MSFSKAAEIEQEVDSDGEYESDALAENQQIVEWVKQQVDAEVVWC